MRKLHRARRDHALVEPVHQRLALKVVPRLCEALHKVASEVERERPALVT